MKKEDGGAAFPSRTDHSYDIKCRCGETLEAFEGRGMTLRDWFAGQALNGCIELQVKRAFNGIPSESYGLDAAKAAYSIADELLAERAKY